MLLHTSFPHLSWARTTSKATFTSSAPSMQRPHPFPHCLAPVWVETPKTGHLQPFGHQALLNFVCLGPRGRCVRERWHWGGNCREGCFSLIYSSYYLQQTEISKNPRPSICHLPPTDKYSSLAHHFFFSSPALAWGWGPKCAARLGEPQNPRIRSSFPIPSHNSREGHTSLCPSTVLGGMLVWLRGSWVCWVAHGGPGAPASPAAGAGSAAPTRSLPSSHLPRRTRRAPHACPPTPTSPPRPSHALPDPSGRANPAPPARGIRVHQGRAQMGRGSCAVLPGAHASPSVPGVADTRPLHCPPVPMASLPQTSPALLIHPHLPAKNTPCSAPERPDIT